MLQEAIGNVTEDVKISTLCVYGELKPLMFSCVAFARYCVDAAVVWNSSTELLSAQRCSVFYRYVVGGVLSDSCCPSVSQSCFGSTCANAREVKTLLNFPQWVPPTNPCKRPSSSCGTTQQSEWKAGRLKPDSLCVALYLQLLLLSLHNFMVSLFFTMSLFHICNPDLSHVQV